MSDSLSRPSRTPDSGSSRVLEIAHVLFMDIMGYSKVPMDKQEQLLMQLQDTVRQTAEFARAQADNQLIRLPTGDGMALVFFGDAEAPVRCAVEIGRSLRNQPALQLRMGIHTGPVYRVADINANRNVAGGGINIAQRVMDCGDAGHILVSSAEAEVLCQVSAWCGTLHDLGEVEVKHGVRLHLYNLYTEEAGNAGIPSRLASVARPRAQKTRKVLHSLAVLPFANMGGDPEMEYLSDGVTDSLINCLSQLSELRVVPRTLVFRYKGLETDLSAVGRDLDVTAVLTGRIAHRADTLLIGTELSDVFSVSQLWGAQYNRKFTDIFAVQEEIAREISEKLRLKLTGEEKQRLAKHPTHNKEAYEFYLKGLHFGHKLSPDSLARAIEYGRLAIDKDSRYAEPYTLLAYCYSMLGTYQFLPPAEAFPKAKAAALKALELGEMMAEPHVALSVVLLLYEWKWSEGEKEALQALELNPDYAFAHQVHSVYLVAQGNLEEALIVQKRAVDLDPLSPTTNLVLGAWLFLARQYPQAIEQLHKTLELEPNLSRARRFLARAYAHLGNFDDAFTEHQKLDAISKGSALNRAVLAYIYSLASRRAEAEEILNDLKKQKLDLETRYFAAAVYAVLGETDEAFELLNSICDDRYTLMNYVGVDPVLDPLRTEPRFRDLLNRLGLPA